MYAWSYPGLRAGSSQFRNFELANGFTLQPAVTYSATEDVFTRPTKKETEDYITGRFG